jgi:hypothetical protein
VPCRLFATTQHTHPSPPTQQQQQQQPKALIGAIAVTPTTFLLPPLLWLFVRRPRIGSAEWLLNVFLVAATGVVGIMGAISAAYLIAEHARDYKAFAS